MNEINLKKVYVWRLATFLHSQGMVMSGSELADHLNRNNFLTSLGGEFKGGRGTYTLIHATWNWLHHDLGLADEAEHVAKAFVGTEGGFPYQK